MKTIGAVSRVVGFAALAWLAPACGGAGARQPAAAAPVEQTATGDDSFRRGFSAMCNCPSAIDLAGLDAAAKSMALAECMNQHATTDELRHWMAAIAQLPPGEKLIMLGRAMERAGLDTCEISALWGCSTTDYSRSAEIADTPPEKATPSQVVMGPPAAVEGALEASTIRRYVRKALPKVRYCYERRLVQEPTLRGVVTVEFTIGATGAVETATVSGLGDRGVDECVRGVLLGIQFPPPKGGASVRVSYPFNFQPAPE